jgi:hypothetical protein
MVPSSPQLVSSTHPHNQIHSGRELRGGAMAQGAKCETMGNEPTPVRTSGFRFNKADVRIKERIRSDPIRMRATTEIESVFAGPFR